MGGWMVYDDADDSALVFGQTNAFYAGLPLTPLIFLAPYLQVMYKFTRDLFVIRP